MFLASGLVGQEFSDLLKSAERVDSEGKFADAAELFEAAWRKKPSREDLIFKAGERFYWTKDYRKAAACFEKVKDENKKFDLVGLKYARALKQDGRYQDAMLAFREFGKVYSGNDKAWLLEILGNDIKGCQMGIDLTTARAPKDLPFDLARLPDDVNTPENEFAPVSFGDDVLYFSSTVSGRSKIYRTQRTEGGWVQSTGLKDFPNIAEEHFGNGVFSPDGRRFYFTECGNYDFGNGLRARCEIYVTRRDDSGWTAVEKLPEYVNFPKSTTTQPCVVHDRGIEHLFFASDREGGEGLMDIWSCQRVLDGSDAVDFSFPQNLGPKVNTKADEITPVFDPASQTLYFSSNGHVSLGGFDIQKSVRNGKRWTKPENLGLPFNSTCDDFSFVLKKSGNGGFFVSNRLFGVEKTSTRHEDIFEFAPRETRLEVRGQALVGGQPATDASIALFEKSEVEGEEMRLLAVRPTSDGLFVFPLLPEKNYVIEAQKDGFPTLTREVGKGDASDNFGYDLRLDFQPSENAASSAAADAELEKARELDKKLAEKEAKSPAQPVEKAQPSEPILVEKPHSRPAPTAEKGPKKASWKVQIAAVDRFSPDDPLFASTLDEGPLEAEFLAEKNLWRVLLGDFSSRADASMMLQKMKAKGFAEAFLVKYENGQRL